MLKTLPFPTFGVQGHRPYSYDIYYIAINQFIKYPFLKSNFNMVFNKPSTICQQLPSVTLVYIKIICYFCKQSVKINEQASATVSRR